jgi:RNA recognition motif-containing protein
MNIFCGSLPFRMTEDELKKLFEQYGDVVSAKIIFDRKTNRSKGFGFVEMFDDEAGMRAIDGLNGRQFYGRTISIKKAEDRPPQKRF